MNLGNGVSVAAAPARTASQVQPLSESAIFTTQQQDVPIPKPKRPTAFTKECVLSEELAAFLRKDRMTRSEVVSAMWRTIREKGLIDPNQKQFAICDDQLLKVIGKKRFKVFGMMKYLKSHIKDPSKM